MSVEKDLAALGLGVAAGVTVAFGVVATATAGIATLPVALTVAIAGTAVAGVTIIATTRFHFFAIGAAIALGPAVAVIRAPSSPSYSEPAPLKQSFEKPNQDARSNWHLKGKKPQLPPLKAQKVI